MAIELRIIGESTAEVVKDIEEISKRFGMRIEGLTIEHDPGDTVVGTAIGEMTGKTDAPEPAKRGRKRRDPAEAAGASTGAAAEAPAAQEPEGGDPFSDDNSDDPFAPAGDDAAGEELTKEQLEAVRKDVMARLQKVYTQKGGADTVNALMSKHVPGEKKIAKFPLEVFPKMAKDLQTLGV